MIALNINEPYLSMILDGSKVVETRTHSRFDRYAGQEVALCRTPGGMVAGYAILSRYSVYTTEEEFRRDERYHRISGGDSLDWRGEGDRRYGYLLENVRLCRPYVAQVVKEYVSHKIIK